MSDKGTVMIIGAGLSGKVIKNYILIALDFTVVCQKYHILAE
jgi:hypothetical protein